MNLQLPDFDSIRVLVAGDLMLDRYWTGSTSRISPEAPVPVVKVQEIEERAGGAANVATNLVTLGISTSLSGIVGDDAEGRQLASLLSAQQINCQFLIEPTATTITKLRVLSRHQQLIRLDFEHDYHAIDASPLIERIASSLAGAHALVISDYGKGCLQDVATCIRMAQAQGIPVLVDPKGNDFGKYRGATVMTPNLAEFEAVMGPCVNDHELVVKGEQLRAELEMQALLITLGERGMLLLRDDHDALHLPTHAREVYDVTGAGDTVIAVLAAALAGGSNMAEAAGLANIAAGLVVARLGTSSVSTAELRRAIHQRSNWNSNLSRDELLQAVEEARVLGERLVMTNGCFDLLHEGHVAYLQAARKLGDRLIVAVNDDDSVRRLKGDDRPVNRLQRRMAILAGLASVDWVVPFTEDTPEQLICAVKPDVLVKGGDYRPEAIAGHDCVQAAGGDVVVMDYIEGASTTDIINAIRKD